VAPYLVLGDSYTEALMVDDEDVFTHRLERLSERDAFGAPVLNLGRSGASAADYVALAPRYRALFSPRWTIVQLGIDDLGDDAWKTDKPHFARRENGRLAAVAEFALPSRFWDLARPLRDHFTLANYGVIRFEEFLHAAAAEPPLFHAGNLTAEKPGPPPDPSVRYPVLAELELLAAAYDGRITFLMLPEFDLARPSEPRSETERLWLRTCAEHGWSCVNLRDVFPVFAARYESPFGFSNTAWNRGHMNAAGHRAAALLLHVEMLKLAARGLL